jgi:flavodoxin
MKKLVAYFSPTGTTKHIAEIISQTAGADIFEIIPEIPYTSEDLEWTDKKSRSSMEMSDKKSRPAIKERISNMEEYGIIFLGFPIWWHIAPTIINTFLESYDFSGKTIVLFATSGGSGMGKALDYLKPSCDGSVKWEAGKVIRSTSDKAEIAAWIKEI